MWFDGDDTLAFHLVISAYGFWLPNDPRGSSSDFVGAWELRKFGPAKKVADSRNYAKDPHDAVLRRAAKDALKYPPVRFNETQRIAIAEGFARACVEARYVCRACCIGFDHAHLVFDTHPREITVISGRLKVHATRELMQREIHPLAGFLGKRGGLPTPWSEGCWRVFLDTPDHLGAAVAYVERHPHKEGLPDQAWSFVSH